MEPQVENVTEMELVFEALVHADRTTISWERLEYAAVELVQVQLEGPERNLDQVIEVPLDLWEEFLELLLNSVLPERSPSASVDEATRPETPTLDAMSDVPPDIGKHVPDAPTAPGRLSAVTFLRCSVSLTFDHGGRTSVIEGAPAMELYSRIYGFAQDKGLELPG